MVEFIGVEKGVTSVMYAVLKTALEASVEDVKTTLETGGEDVKTTIETSGGDVIATLETGGEDGDKTSNHFGRCITWTATSSF